MATKVLQAMATSAAVDRLGKLSLDSMMSTRLSRHGTMKLRQFHGLQIR